MLRIVDAVDLLDRRAQRSPRSHRDHDRLRRAKRAFDFCRGDRGDGPRGEGSPIEIRRNARPPQPAAEKFVLEFETAGDPVIETELDQPVGHCARHQPLGALARDPQLLSDLILRLLADVIEPGRPGGLILETLLGNSRSYIAHGRVPLFFDCRPR